METGSAVMTWRVTVRIVWLSDLGVVLACGKRVPEGGWLARHGVLHGRPT